MYFLKDLKRFEIFSDGYLPWPSVASFIYQDKHSEMNLSV